jgi:hypothetical protein
VVKKVSVLLVRLGELAGDTKLVAEISEGLSNLQSPSNFVTSSSIATCPIGMFAVFKLSSSLKVLI